MWVCRCHPTEPRSWLRTCATAWTRLTSIVIPKSRTYSLVRIPPDGLECNRGAYHDKHTIMWCTRFLFSSTIFLHGDTLAITLIVIRSLMMCLYNCMYDTIVFSMYISEERSVVMFITLLDNDSDSTPLGGIWPFCSPASRFSILFATR